MYFYRQIFSKIVNGTVTSLKSKPQSLVEIKPSGFPYIELGVTEMTKGYAAIATGATYTLPLPTDYTNASYLHVYFRTEATMRVESTISGQSGTQKSLIYGSSVRPGIMVCADRFTTLTVVNTAATTQYLYYELITLPDITEASNFQDVV